MRADLPAAAPLVLVVEDERPIADLVRTVLQRDGYRVHVAGDGRSALADVRRARPALVVLDVGLPGMDGISVCRALRESGDWTPIIFLTARDEESDRVLGLELGADDYVTKPFSPRELLARLRAVLRRHHGCGDQLGGDAAVVRVGRLSLDLDRRQARVDEEPAPRSVALSTTEFDLLAYLARRPGRVATREELLAQVWGYPPGRVSRTVDVHIAQVRAKLAGAVAVRSVRGVGYAIEPVGDA